MLWCRVDLHVFSALIFHIAVRVCTPFLCLCDDGCNVSLRFFFVLTFRGQCGVRGMRTIHCAMCVFNDQVGERKSWKSLIHRSCTDLGHDVLSVGCVVLKTRSWGDRGVIGSSEGLPANVFHSWSLSFLSLPIFLIKIQICELSLYVWRLSVFHVSSPRGNLRWRRSSCIGSCIVRGVVHCRCKCSVTRPIMNVESCWIFPNSPV